MDEDDLNIRKKIRTALLPDPKNYSSSPLAVKTVDDISKAIGPPNEGNYIDLNPGVPSYEEDELPKIHIEMANEISERNSISLDQRDKSFTMNITYYSLGYLDGDFKLFKNEDREKMLTHLENVGIEIDRSIFRSSVDRTLGVTEFDLENIEYNIDRSQSGQSIVGNTRLRYTINYYIQYPK